MSDRIPLKYQIADKLKEQIVAGVYQRDNMMPSEAEICKSFNVSRTTAIAALQLLQNEGYLYRIQGKGTFVKERKIISELAPQNTFFGNIVSEVPVNHESPIIQIKTCLATPLIAEKLNISVDDRVVFLKRVRLIDGEPVALTWSYLLWEYGKDLLAMPLDGSFSIYNYIRTEYLQEPIGDRMTLSMEEVSAEDAFYLHIPEHTICWKTKSCSLIQDKVFEYAQTLMLSEKFEFVIDRIALKRNLIEK